MQVLWFTNTKQEVALHLCAVQYLQSTKALPSLLLFLKRPREEVPTVMLGCSFYFSVPKVLQVTLPARMLLHGS